MNADPGSPRGIRFPLAVTMLVAGLLLAGLPARAALERANAYLVGKEFGNGRSLNINSGKELIHPSAQYSFEVVGSVTGTGTLAKVLPGKTKLGDFMNLISPGASGLLKGRVPNPSGSLPAVLFSGRIAGSEQIKDIGRVSISLKLRVEILANGEIVAKISNVKIKSPVGRIPGTIRFLKGSKVVVTTAPRIGMALVKQGFDEGAGTVRIDVTRFGFQKSKCSVKFSTIDGTAAGGSDFIHASGTIHFAKGETRKSIPIALIDNKIVDGNRGFTVALSSPGGGAVIGPKPSMVVVIRDDD